MAKVLAVGYGAGSINESQGTYELFIGSASDPVFIPPPGQPGLGQFSFIVNLNDSPSIVLSKTIQAIKDAYFTRAGIVLLNSDIKLFLTPIIPT